MFNCKGKYRSNAFAYDIKSPATVNRKQGVKLRKGVK